MLIVVLPVVSVMSPPLVMAVTAPPDNVSAGLISPDQIELQWDDPNSGPDQEQVVIIQRKPYQNDDTWSVIAELPADTTSYVDTGLYGEVVYSYRVGMITDATVYLFCYFRDSWSGIHYEYSYDAVNWYRVDDPRYQLFFADVGDWGQMRDPHLSIGHDGTYHLVWTTSHRGFGYAHSNDLVNWHDAKLVRVDNGAGVDGFKNVWAPEVYYDVCQSQYLVIWASTRSDAVGEFPGPMDHRHYFVTTQDFLTFSQTMMYYDPGYTSIDGTLYKDGGTYYLVFKDERDGQKAMRYTTSSSPYGPFSQTPSSKFTPSMTEGPSVVPTPDGMLSIFYDHFTQGGRYGVVKTTNWQSFTPGQYVDTPDSVRHGSFIQISEAQLQDLFAHFEP